eukprot:TRINITY_DN0_c662_g1_i1.p1 TRINITY_DN0_c662_g1~~TRINITY_DN0_c662_g1_i1.p1  ORF type:complete len:236 (+),score=66.12 TRINITY_DN0_c662_g1_i1:60-767(+)
MTEALFLKVIVVGDSGVGKTSLLNQYCYGRFDNNTKPTVGCDFSLKAFNDYNGRSIRMQLWDVAGQEKFHSLSRLYVRGAYGCIIVCDVTNEDSMRSALKWKGIVEENADLLDGKVIPIILLQNKKDLLYSLGEVQDYMREEFLSKFAEENKFLRSYQVSAKTGENIEEAVKFLLDEILSRNLAKAGSIIDRPSTLSHIGNTGAPNAGGQADGKVRLNAQKTGASGGTKASGGCC